MLDPTYNPTSFEPEIYQLWENSTAFKASEHPTQGEKNFLITMPPPNVTGALHIGHALFVSLQDTYIRWKRMQGFNTLWLPGSDHAGIATQVMVERQVESEGTSRAKLGRAAFLERVWEWKHEYGSTIMEQIRALGSSCDWSRELFTLDKKSSSAVRESFARLYHDGLIYRGERIVNWSSGLQTAISDLEVEQRPTQGFLYYLKYPLADSPGEFLSVATTRPETIFADVAIAVNPKDERFKKFHDKEVVIPLCGRKIPVITDDYVDMEFGTGALKITPGHDVNDWQVGQRHKLKTLSCIGKDGKLNELAGEFQGMVAAHSRKRVAEKLNATGALLKEEKHNYELGYCQRSGVVVEPLISMQWFVKMESLAVKAKAAAEGENPALRFYPDFWKKTWFEWLTNIQDWCISRQLWWGHQIPAWHCQDCRGISVPKSSVDLDPTKCSVCGSEKIIQDPDVLDTWYSSGLWPISTLGWPEKTPDLSTFYPKQRFDQARQEILPAAMMETGSDILFFWVARMVMMCTHFMDGKIPFEDVFLHSMVRDEKGQKMSKTKGNVVDPLEIIEKHGADCLRLTLLALSGQGSSVNLDLKRMEGYKGFLNKIWNASKFVFIAIEEQKITTFKDPREQFSSLDFVDQWILISLDKCVAEFNRELANYRPDAAFHALYQFAWYEFCDWYLEMYKIKKGSAETMVFCLDTIFKLLHPMAPLVTEKLYGELPWGKCGTLLTQKFPVAKVEESNAPNSLRKMSALKSLVEGIRNFRTENRINPKLKIRGFLSTKDPELFSTIQNFAVGLGGLESISVNSASPSGMSGKVATDFFDLTIPLDGLVDQGAEKNRLQAELKKAISDRDFSEKRLANPGFVDRAKPELVELEKQNLALVLEKIRVLEDSIKKLS